VVLRVSRRVGSTVRPFCWVTLSLTVDDCISALVAYISNWMGVAFDLQH
jgi:hypothetical protein